MVNSITSGRLVVLKRFVWVGINIPNKLHNSSIPNPPLFDLTYSIVMYYEDLGRMIWRHVFDSENLIVLFFD